MTQLSMRHNLLVARHNVELFWTILAGCDGLYPVGQVRIFLPFNPSKAFSLFVFFVRACATALTIYFVGLSGLYRIAPFRAVFSSYRMEPGGLAPDCFVGSLRFEHLGGGRLFRWTTTNWNVLGHLRFYISADRMSKDTIFLAVAFHCMIKIYWSYSGGSQDFFLSDFAAGTIKGYLTEKIVTIKRQKVDDGQVAPIMTSAADWN